MMRRTETIAEGITLHLGDCREILPTLGRADLVLTDPPYGVRDDDWDAMAEQEFARFSMEWIAACRPLSPELITFCTEGSAIRKLVEMVYPKVRPMFWFKPPGSQYPGARERTRWFAFESVLHCYEPSTWSVVEPKDNAVGEAIKVARERTGLSRGGVDIALRGKKTGLCFRWEEGACLPTPEQADKLAAVIGLNGAFHDILRDAYDGRDRIKALAAEKASENAAGRTDVLTYRTVTGSAHPCEKPLGLMDELIRDSGAEYASIIDPFMGSGSTGVAAVKLGRRFTGIEIDHRYFDLACKRIADALRQTDLFVERPAPAKQLTFDVQ